MQRDSRAYLADILESCDAISTALSGVQIEDYLNNRLVRSSVEREFTIIGEAVQALSRKAPYIFNSITNARRIVDFRNRLTHDYPTIDDELVWALAMPADGYRVAALGCEPPWGSGSTAASSPVQCRQCISGNRDRKGHEQYIKGTLENPRFEL